MNRRMFTTAVGAVALGIFGRIRFSPSAGGPRGRRLIRSRKLAWGDFEFEVINGKALACSFRGEPMGVELDERFSDSPLEYLPYVHRSNDYLAVVSARVRDDGNIGVSAVALYKRADSDVEMIEMGEFWGFPGDPPPTDGERVVFFEPSYLGPTLFQADSHKTAFDFLELSPV